VDLFAPDTDWQGGACAAADRDMANAVGINVPLVYTGVCALGTALAGIMGVFHGPMMNIHLDVDQDYVVEAFAVVVIGGLGSVPGALLGALLVGMLDAFGILIIRGFKWPSSTWLWQLCWSFAAGTLWHAGDPSMSEPVYRYLGARARCGAPRWESDSSGGSGIGASGVSHSSSCLRPRFLSSGLFALAFNLLFASLAS